MNAETNGQPTIEVPRTHAGIDLNKQLKRALERVTQPINEFEFSQMWNSPQRTFLLDNVLINVRKKTMTLREALIRPVGQTKAEIAEIRRLNSAQWREARRHDPEFMEKERRRKRKERKASIISEMKYATVVSNPQVVERKPPAKRRRTLKTPSSHAIKFKFVNMDSRTFGKMRKNRSPSGSCEPILSGNSCGNFISNATTPTSNTTTPIRFQYIQFTNPSDSQTPSQSDDLSDDLQNLIKKATEKMCNDNDNNEDNDKHGHVNGHVDGHVNENDQKDNENEHVHGHAHYMHDINDNENTIPEQVSLNDNPSDTPQKKLTKNRRHTGDGPACYGHTRDQFNFVKLHKTPQNCNAEERAKVENPIPVDLKHAKNLDEVLEMMLNEKNSHNEYDNADLEKLDAERYSRIESQKVHEALYYVPIKIEDVFGANFNPGYQNEHQNEGEQPPEKMVEYVHDFLTKLKGIYPYQKTYSVLGKAKKRTYELEFTCAYHAKGSRLDPNCAPGLPKGTHSTVCSPARCEGRVRIKFNFDEGVLAIRANHKHHKCIIQHVKNTGQDRLF